MLARAVALLFGALAGALFGDLRRRPVRALARVLVSRAAVTAVHRLPRRDAIAVVSGGFSRPHGGPRRARLRGHRGGRAGFCRSRSASRCGSRAPPRGVLIGVAPLFCSCSLAAISSARASTRACGGRGSDRLSCASLSFERRRPEGFRTLGIVLACSAPRSSRCATRWCAGPRATPRSTRSAHRRLARRRRDRARRVVRADAENLRPPVGCATRSSRSCQRPCASAPPTCA